MKKSLILLAIIITATGIFAVNSKFVQRYYYVYFKTDNMFVNADVDSFDKGPDVGSPMPAIRAILDGSQVMNIASLAGSNGTLLVVNRSLEWCPFCMRQSIELQNIKSEFDAKGIAIVMMTYDKPDIQQAFINRHSIQYPILSDINGESFANLAVLREEYGPDDMNYGLPYPGMFVVDTDGIIRGKLFIEAYSYRVASHAVLDFATEHLLK